MSDSYPLPQDFVKEGEIKMFQHHEKVVAVTCLHGKLIAFEEMCPHRAGPLSEGKIQDGKIRCPWHHSEFVLESGQCLSGPAKRPLKKIAVTIV